jgi:tRNA-dihydrouridine synthase 1
MRILPSGESDTLALARMLQDHGAQVLTVHGRTRFMKQQNTGVPDWQIINKIKYLRARASAWTHNRAAY